MRYTEGMPQTRLRLSIFAGIAFFALTLLLAVFPGTALDRGWSEFIQRFVPRAFDPLLSLFSLLGSFELQAALLFGLLWSYRVEKRKMLAYAGIFTLGMVIEVLGKSLLWHPGPTKDLFRYDLPFVFASSHVQTGFSYPSGHSYRSVFLALLLLWELKEKNLPQKKKMFWSRVVWIALGIMLLSRVSLGEHWSTDVLGGSLLGLSCAGFAWSAAHKKQASVYKDAKK